MNQKLKKLHINNKTINVQAKDYIPKMFTLTKENNNETKTIKNKRKRNTVKEQVNHC